MTEMSAAEAAVVARFEAGEPAPESWCGGLRETLVEQLRAGNEPWPGAPSPEVIIDAILALPELAALRAKAAAADRVEATVARSEELRYPTVSTAVLRRRLDGTEREDRGRC